MSSTANKPPKQIDCSITRLKQAEEVLRESENRYRRLVELSPDAIMIHCEGKIVFANIATAKILGAAKTEEIIGKPLLDFVHPHYREIVKKRILHIKEQEKAAPLIEEKFIRLNGSVIDVEVATIPLIHRGKPAVQVIARDITERKQVEELLQKQSSAINASIDGIAILNHDEKYIYLNDAHVKIYGYDNPGELIGKTWRVLYEYLKYNYIPAVF